jgi:CheY-like chemotaxis protein
MSAAQIAPTASRKSAERNPGASREGGGVVATINAGPASHRVLVVDDHDDTRDVFTVMLEAGGCTVFATRHAHAAYAALRNGLRPCVVLLDLHMPDIDGWAFLDGMRREPEWWAVPVVLVSGDPDQKPVAWRRGCEFLLKPIERQTCVAVVNQQCTLHRPDTARPRRRTSV